MRKRIFELFVAVGLTVISTIGTIALIEYGGRWIFGRYPSDYKPERFTEKNNQFGWLHIPGASGYWYLYSDGTKNIVNINSSGFSDNEFPTRLDETTYRIAVIGDSVVQAWEVEEEKRFIELLREIFKSTSDKKIEILNFGIRGIGTDQELLLLKNIVAKYSPKIVLLFFCLNDIDNIRGKTGKPYYTLDEGVLHIHNYPVSDEISSQIEFSPDNPINYLRQNSWVVELIYNRSKFIREIDKKYIQRHHESNDEQLPHLVMSKEIYKSSKEVDEAWILYESLLREFKSVSSSLGMELVLVANPSIRTLRPIQDVDYFKPFRMIDKITTKLQIEYVNIPDIFHEMELLPKDIFHREDWWHYNELGNKLVAEILWKYLSPKIDIISADNQNQITH